MKGRGENNEQGEGNEEGKEGGREGGRNFS